MPQTTEFCALQVWCWKSSAKVRAGGLSPRLTEGLVLAAGRRGLPCVHGPPFSQGILVSSSDKDTRPTGPGPT